MGLLRGLLALPVRGPLDATRWVASKIHEAADQELNSPAAIRKALQTLEHDLLSGAISEEEYDVAETVLLRRLKGST